MSTLGGALGTALLRVVEIIFPGVVWFLGASLNPVIGAIVPFVAGFFMAWILWGRRQKHKTQRYDGDTTSSEGIPDSLVKMSFNLHSNRITARVHDDLKLEFESDTKAQGYFDDIVKQQYVKGEIKSFAENRFRLVCPPSLDKGDLILDLAPFNFAYFDIMNSEYTSDTAKEYVNDQIEALAWRIRERFPRSDLHINARNWSLIGVEVMLVTSDATDPEKCYTLLRRRGRHVAIAKNVWSTSFGGMCDPVRMRGHPERLDILQSVRNELDEEIGPLSADPQNMFFIGFHVNTRTGATDLLGLWKTQANWQELVGLITERKPKVGERFQNTLEAKEPYVYDNQNLIVEFNGRAIFQGLVAVREEMRREEPDRPFRLNPEMVACVVRSLQVSDQAASARELVVELERNAFF